MEPEPTASTITRAHDPLAPLLARAIAREPAALRGLLDGVAPEVVRVIRTLVGAGAADFDDLVQEALLGFVRALADFRGESTLRRFARRIAARSALATRRAVQRKAAHHEGWLRGEVLGGALHHEAPDEEALDEWRREALRGLLAELPEAQSRVLVLRIVAGFSLEEIAELTDAPLNTVRSRLRLAKEALRARIAADARLTAQLTLQEGRDE